MCTIYNCIFNKLWGHIAIYKCEIRKATILWMPVLNNTSVMGFHKWQKQPQSCFQLWRHSGRRMAEYSQNLVTIDKLNNGEFPTAHSLSWITRQQYSNSVPTIYNTLEHQRFKLQKSNALANFLCKQGQLWLLKLSLFWNFKVTAFKLHYDINVSPLIAVKGCV
jgi:hypothetical protein